MLLFLSILYFLFEIQNVEPFYSPTAKNSCKNLYLYPIRWFSKSCYNNPSVMATAPEMIEINGYKCQSHNVITEDGYNLTMHRVVNKNGRNNKGKPAFIQHSILADSTNWVSTDNNSLAFYLFGKGYDVWLGNFRGSRYSRTHTKLKDSNQKFWDYSLDNLALQDLPTMLQSVVKKTGQKVIYIGHSLGSATLMMYASEQPKEVNKLVSVALLLSPTFYQNLDLPVKITFVSGYYLSKLLLLLDITNIARHSVFIALLLQEICPFFPYACRIGKGFAFGNSDQWRSEDLLLLLSFNSLTITAKSLRQFGYLAKTNILRKYDYGKKENLKKYGTESAPIYDLSKVTLPEVHLYYTKYDAFIKLEGTKKLLDEIKSPSKDMKLVPINGLDAGTKFGHLEFMYSRNLHTFLYPDFDKVLKNYPA